MSYTAFNKKKYDHTKEHMFFGEPVGAARFDTQKHQIFNKLAEQQIGYFWVPEEINVSQDKRQYNNLQDHEKHIFLSNLRYQTLLDSVQGRSPTVCFLPIVSLPELENWIETWAFSESIHSRSYTHIIRNILNDPSEAFDNITTDKHIMSRATDVSRYYDELHNLNCIRQVSSIEGFNVSYNEYDHKVALYKTMFSVNALEAIRFYVSFACSFAFVENEQMSGNGSIIKLIARDEALHHGGTNKAINYWRNGKDDPVMAEIAETYKDTASKIFHDAMRQEESWAEYLFHQGSMLGLNANIIIQYIRFITAKRMKVIGIEPQFDVPNNPIPWMESYINSSMVQTTPQEKELSSYITGGIDTSFDITQFNELKL